MATQTPKFDLINAKETPGAGAQQVVSSGAQACRLLASLPEDTPVKIEVGAIGVDDNATFTEAHGFCVNEVEGCEDD